MNTPDENDEDRRVVDTETESISRPAAWTPPQGADADALRAQAIFHADTLEAAAILTGALREDLRHMVNHARPSVRSEYGAAVADTLLPRVETALVENLVEWLDAKGWAELEADPEHRAKVEAEVVKAWKACKIENAHYVVYVKNFRELKKHPHPLAVALGNLKPAKTPEEEKQLFGLMDKAREAGVYSRIVHAVAVMDRAKGEDLPKKIETAHHVAALEGLRELMASHMWMYVAPGLSAPNPKWLRMLAGPWLQEQAKAEADRLQREMQARPLKILTVKTSEGEHARLPKLTAGISWAFGAEGIELPEGYKVVPAVAALVPPGYAILKDADLKRPHQAILPMLVEDEDAPPLILAVAGAGREVFTPAAAWLAVYVMAACWDKPEVLRETNLLELTKCVYPDAPRLRMDKHFAYVAGGLAMMRSARLLWPNGYADSIFYVPRWAWKMPSEEDLDKPLVVGLDQHFLKRTLPDMAAATGIKGIGGQFTFNLEKTMNLDKQKPGLLRQYLRTMAAGNDYYDHATGKRRPEAVKEMTAERWAMLTNYLPNTAMPPPPGQKTVNVGRVARSKAIKRMLADIDELNDKKMVTVAKATHAAVRLLLTPTDMEAWEAFRAGQHRGT